VQKIADMKSEKCAEVVCFWLCDENAAYANLSCQNCGQVIGWQDGRAQDEAEILAEGKCRKLGPATK